MNGVALCSRFSLPTADRRFCGPATAPTSLRASLRGEDAPGRRDLRRFEALFPYLEVIAEETGGDPLDEEVVEAYWIGNRLHERDWRSAFPEILRRLVKRGLPQTIATRLAGSLPPRPLPYHTFHVLFVGVGVVTGHVPTTLRNMDACRVRWGRVTDSGSRLEVVSEDLVRPQGAFALAGPRRRRQDRGDGLGRVAEGDVVASHWGEAVLRLSDSQTRSVERFTAEAIASANEAAVRPEPRLPYPLAFSSSST